MTDTKRKFWPDVLEVVRPACKDIRDPKAGSQKKVQSPPHRFQGLGTLMLLKHGRFTEQVRSRGGPLLSRLYPSYQRAPIEISGKEAAGVTANHNVWIGPSGISRDHHTVDRASKHKPRPPHGRNPEKVRPLLWKLHLELRCYKAQSTKKMCL